MHSIFGTHKNFALSPHQLCSISTFRAVDVASITCNFDKKYSTMPPLIELRAIFQANTTLSYQLDSSILHNLKGGGCGKNLFLSLMILRMVLNLEKNAKKLIQQSQK